MNCFFYLFTIALEFLAGNPTNYHFGAQVLVNLGGLARLEWRHWDMFTREAIGTVAYNAHTFVARFRSGQSGLVVGELDFNRGLSGNIRAYVDANTTELSANGEALVEIEPDSYRLENISLVSWREKTIDREVVLGTVRLTLEEQEEWKEEKDDDWQEVEDSLFYSQNVSRYWGHVGGTVRGLPASATIGNATYSFRWGLAWEGRDEGVVQVGTRLRPGTYTTATLQAGTNLIHDFLKKKQGTF